MVKGAKTYDYAVHSDFLIHWTGKDFDNENWAESHRSLPTELYLRRLKDIVTYGLWMTEEPARSFSVGSSNITIPPTPKCCFTELKLSESRKHAWFYGRLGIGVKRSFLFDRFGRPVTYFGFSENSHRDKFIETCARDLKDKTYLNFFQAMNRDPGCLNYDLYSESEWRILFFDELLKTRAIIDPRDNTSTKEHRYFNTLTPVEQNKLKYLLPLDGWFSMIIYPSLAVKNHVQWQKGEGAEIFDEIKRIKTKANDHGNNVENGNWPIEVDLDACRHF